MLVCKGYNKDGELVTFQTRELANRYYSVDEVIGIMQEMNYTATVFGYILPTTKQVWYD
jgi:hypothetical protein